MAKAKFPLGKLLVEREIITPEQLFTALKKQKETGELLGAVLLDLGYIDEETIFLPVLAGQLGVEFTDLKSKEIPQEVISKIPARFATHYHIIPIEFKGNTLTLATTQPLDIHVLDEIGLVVNANIKTVLAGEKDIDEAIRKYFGTGAETIDQMMEGVKPGETLDESVADIEEIESEASISKFLNQILIEAYRDRATDIHIEPYENQLSIRFRVDGVMYEAKVPKNIVHFKDAIISRIKILSNLNIAEKRKPQDGRFKVRIGEIDLDLRVSFLPTPYGESVVIRLLSSTKLYSFQELGLTDDEQNMMKNLTAKPHGIIFLTGPTGSGKTTTLYSCLSSIDTGRKKVITLEDPVEYQLQGITQIQINQAVGLTFANGLRSVLRHDPDIVLVGEVRDKETAEIAIQVALTGHLIFSTLHTNDAVGGVARLMDMEIEPFLITSTVECFIAQRLVRLLCAKCKQKTVVTKEIIKDFHEEVGAEEDVIIYEAKGCKQCNETGYMGRAPIYEILLMNEEIRQLTMERASPNILKEKAIALGMRTLRQSGWEKVKQGITSAQEVIRVTQEEE